MRAEIFSNPFWQNTSVTPVVVAYQDASEFPPYNLAWMALITVMDVDNTSTEFEPSTSGFPVRSQSSDGAHLKADIREELISALAEAGYGDLDIYEVELGRIKGVDTQKHLGKVDAQVSTPTPRF